MKQAQHELDSQEAEWPATRGVEPTFWEQALLSAAWPAGDELRVWAQRGLRLQVALFCLSLASLHVMDPASLKVWPRDMSKSRQQNVKFTTTQAGGIPALAAYHEG